MNSVTLRTLLREPSKVKRLTRTGKSVQVTDGGEPLWVIHPAVTPEDEDRRKAEMEKELADVLRQPVSDMPLSKIILESRR